MPLPIFGIIGSHFPVQILNSFKIKHLYKFVFSLQEFLVIHVKKTYSTKVKQLCIRNFSVMAILAFLIGTKEEIRNLWLMIHFYNHFSITNMDLLVYNLKMLIKKSARFARTFSSRASRVARKNERAEQYQNFYF